MKYLINNEAILCKYLSRSFWSGQRWIVFDTGKRLDENNIHCFQSYEAAVLYCEEHQNPDGVRKIAVLSNLLQQLNSNKEKRKKTVIPKVDVAQIGNNYPLVCFPENIDWQTALCGRRFFPVFWEKLIYPLKDIHSYKIVVEKEKVVKSGMETKLVKEVISHADNFMDANSSFMTMASMLARADKRHYMQLVCEILFAGDTALPKTLPESGRYIELYRFGYQKRRQAFLVQQIADITSPLLLPIVYFAKYNYSKSKLEFYDGALKKVHPGSIHPGIDLRYYLPDDDVFCRR